LAEGLTYRVSDILQYADFRDDFANKIGKYNVGVLDQIKDLYIYDFGIFIEVSPDEEEKAQLEANIQMALSKGDINLEDAIDIREVKNLKLANQLLKVKRIKKQEREEKMQMQMQAMQAQQNLKAQEMSNVLAVQKIQMETEKDIKIEQARVAFAIEKMNAEAELKSKLMAEEFDYKIRIVEMTEAQLANRDDMKEEGKSKRISQQNTEQSRLINQRKLNLPPQNFESNEDSLDGFDLAEFEVR